MFPQGSTFPRGELLLGSVSKSGRRSSRPAPAGSQQPRLFSPGALPRLACPLVCPAGIPAKSPRALAEPQLGETEKKRGRKPRARLLIRALEPLLRELILAAFEVENAEVEHRLLELIQPDFEPTTWQAFRRVVLDGARAAVVAAELGLSVNAVFIAKSRVQRRLREEMRGLVE